MKYYNKFVSNHEADDVRKIIGAHLYENAEKQNNSKTKLKAEDEYIRKRTLFTKWMD